MKLVIASDIHGSAKYCAELIEAFVTEEADKLILLGDILYHGPRNALPDGYDPKATAQMLNDLAGKVAAVRGNCDAEIDQAVLNFPIMADYALLFCEGRTLFLTHGHLYEGDARPPLSDGDILLSGHTHVPVCEERDGYTVCNPGSVSIPKEGSNRGYILIDGGTMIWKTLSGEEYMRYRIKKGRERSLTSAAFEAAKSMFGRIKARGEK
ncbi:MAG: phosphodiesterase [Clostridia bacterium]|nr:phosphodiesterase [Clostridia bacterium]